MDIRRQTRYVFPYVWELARVADMIVLEIISQIATESSVDKQEVVA